MSVMTRRRLMTVLVVTLGSSSVALAQDPVRTTILGTAGNDVLTGTAGDDSLFGLAGADTLNGGAGDDDLIGGPGPDRLSGGPGSDVVAYPGTTPVSVTLDGDADDGAAGEGDNVASDVETVIGGDGSDRLTGGDGAQTLIGEGGDDVLDGKDDADVILGEGGDDVITADDGDRDEIDCGPGDDKLTADGSDVVENCEQVTYANHADVALTLSVRRAAGVIRLTAISGSRLTPGATVTVVCSGKSCPSKKPRVTRIRAGKTSAALVGPLAGRRLAAGTTLQVTVGGAVDVERIFLYKIRAATADPPATRSVRCRVGGGRVRSC